MMIYLPAIFFLICTIHSFVKNGLNVQVLMYGLYFVTGVASILLDHNNLYAYNCLPRDTGIIAPIVYCFLLWMCISPFGKIKENRIRSVEVRYPKILDKAVYFYFGIFLIIVLVASTRLEDVLFNSALAEIRQQAYNGGNNSFYDHLSGIPRYVCALTTFFLASSFFMIPVFFYNLVFRKKSMWFNIITLMGSCCQLLTSIMQADRSQFVYWMILFAFSFLFFRRMMTKVDFKKLFTLISPVVGAILVYFMAVSISRWGESAGGTEGGSIRYAGQNFFNFCTFFYECWDTPITFTELFPLTYYLTGQESYFEWCEVVERSNGIFTANFSTFLGIISSMSTPLTAFIYCIVFRVLAIVYLKRKNLTSVTFYEFTKYWILALVPLLGIFGSYYMWYAGSIAIIIWLILGLLTQKKIKCNENFINRSGSN